MSSSKAASMTQIWSGTCYLTPLLGAFIADTWLGRFRVILSFSCMCVALPVPRTKAGQRMCLHAWQCWVWRRPRSSAYACPASPPSQASYCPCGPCSYMLGLVGLLLSAALPGLKPQPGEGADSSSQGIFWAG